MKPVKQNTIRRSIDRYGITLIESKQQFTATVLDREGRALHLTAMKRKQT